MPNSSTFSSDRAEAPRWRRFLSTLLGWLVGLVAFVYAFVLIVDPYDTLPYSPAFEREPISTNARFSFPGVAAKERFDSAIFGTSTSRLLRPTELDRRFGAHFVNLAMNSATAYEQHRMFDLFVHHHPRPKVVIIGVDVVWCETGDDPPRFTFRPFPPWLYDYKPWNDAFHLFNKSAVEQAGRQAARAIGLRKPKYGLDGYTNFLPLIDEYDLVRARQNIYGSPEPREHQTVVPPADGYLTAVAALRYPTLGRLETMLDSLPAETLKIPFFVPYHQFHQPVPGSLDAARWAECKRRVASISARFDNTHALDFMIPSRITGDDANYWDALHYNTRVATVIEAKLHEAVRTPRSQPNYFVYLNAAEREQ